VLTFSGKDGIETDIPFLPRSADPSVSVSDSSGVQFNDYVIDYWFEDADYVIEDTERFKLGVWTPVTRWRGQDVQNMEVQAYKGPDGKRRYRTRVKKAQTKKVKPEERTGEEVDLDLKRLKDLRTKYAEDIQPIKLAEEALETVRTDFAGFGQAAPIGHVPENLEKLLKNSIALQAKLADLDSQLRMAGRREKIRGNKGLLLETTKTDELKELVELYEDAADHIGAMTRRFFDRLDEWKEQFGMTSLNTELDNWHDADKQVTDTANVTTSLHTAMFCLNKLPAYLRHSLKVFKDGINISTGGIYTSTAYPEKATPNEIKTQKKWAGMYFGAHDGKIIVENAPFGMANTIVHEIAHAIDYEILGLSMLPAHGWKKTRLGREFDKYWQVMKDQFEEYGQTNPAEGFATALTMYLTNDDWMRSHQPGIYHWIDENIGMSPQHREYKRRWREIVKENEQKAKAITEKQAKGEF